MHDEDLPTQEQAIEEFAREVARAWLDEHPGALAQIVTTPPARLAQA